MDYQLGIDWASGKDDTLIFTGCAWFVWELHSRRHYLLLGLN